MTCLLKKSVRKFFRFSAFAAAFLCLASCSSDDDDESPFTGIKISCSTSAKTESTLRVTGTFYSEDNADSSVELSYTITSSTENIAYFGTEGTTKVKTLSGITFPITTGTSEGSFTLTAAATVNGTSYSEPKTITVSDAILISASDTPVGYAEIDTSKFANTVKVSTKSELVEYAKKGGYLIYVSGMIDMSDGMLPSTAGGTTDELDSFVAKNTSSYTSYTTFRDAYAELCSSSTDDKSSSSTSTTLSQTLWSLNKAYGNVIKLNVASNTAIIGLDSSSGIKGGSIQVSGVSNVVIRNLTIQDAYDPFPHHEKNDGFNAQWDNISVKSSAKNIWIDHCTLEDTMKYIKVTTSSGSEKWQTYDGLCDITSAARHVVVSYNILKNHDKTMLVGSSDSDLSGGYITIHHNEFLNCGQRLPMTTYPNMHIFNNVYLRDSNAYYSQHACIVGRYAAYTIIAENNYFGSGVKNCLTTSTNASGKCYASGNVFDEKSPKTGLATATSAPFTPSYTYSDILETASGAKTTVEENAGAGIWSVKQ